MPTRRQFLTTAATAGVLGSTYAGPAAAEYAEQPDHVTIKGYDEATAAIETYQPLLDLSNVSVTPSRQYAWRVTSDEYDADWYCYWAFYSAQQGATSEDSHLPDREPLYVAVTDDGVDRVIHSEWHYSAAVDDDPSLYQDTHPRFRVIEPWHGTTPTTTNGEFVTLGDMTDVYADWLVNSWSVHRPSVVDPSIVEDRGNWWREDDQFNHRLAVLFYELTDGGFVPETFRLD